MKKIVASLVVVTLLSATVATQAFADGWDRHHRGGAVVAFDPLWPITAALTLPVAIAASVARATIPPPVVVEHRVYEAPPAYYRPGAYYAPRTYYDYDYREPGYHHYREYRYGW